MTVKLTKPYILEGLRFEEGTELVIVSDGENEVVTDTPSEPQNEIDFGLVADEDKTDVKDEELPLKESDDENEEEKSE
jgi:hypothetical protein